MRIVIWNCAMGLARKFHALEGLRPDIAIIPECAFGIAEMLPTIRLNAAWIGDNPNKGLAIVGFGDYQVRRHTTFDPNFKYFLPAEIHGPARFNLLGVWAFNHRVPSRCADRDNACGRPTLAIDHYAEFLRDEPSIIAGDFNHSVIWDGPRKKWNHAETLAKLDGMEFTSAYHTFHHEKHGTESRETLYWRDRSLSGSAYHIDYCFIPKLAAEDLRSVKVEGTPDWLKLSDHVPLIVDLEPAAMRIRSISKSSVIENLT